MRLDPFSLSTAHLTILAEHQGFRTVLAPASGFFVDVQGQPFLATAWHNLSGRDPASLKLKRSNQAIPTQVRVRATYRHHEIVQLYRRDSFNEKGIWSRCFRQHPLRPDIDVAALRVPGSPLRAGEDPTVPAFQANRGVWRRLRI